MAIRCQPCQAVLGAEVEGVDLRQVPDATTIDVLEEALECYGVLIFRAQHFTPEEQVAWSHAFGPLALTRGTETRLPTCPEILGVSHLLHTKQLSHLRTLLDKLGNVEGEVLDRLIDLNVMLPGGGRPDAVMAFLKPSQQPHP